MPFSEETADALDHWSTAVKMSKVGLLPLYFLAARLTLYAAQSSVEGRWQHDLGEVMGPGQGQFTVRPCQWCAP